MTEAVALVLSQLVYGGLCLWAAWRLKTKSWAAMCLAPLLLISWIWWDNKGFPRPADPSLDPFGMNVRIRSLLLFTFCCLAFITAAGGAVIVARSRKRRSRRPPAYSRQAPPQPLP
jgi:hypothetical protein